MIQPKSIFTYHTLPPIEGCLHFHFDTCNSTNDEAEALLKALPQDSTPQLDIGIIITSDIQLSGKGQFGRTWESQKGGLFYTFIKKITTYTPNQTPQFVSKIGEIVASVSSQLSQLPIMHHAPNDLYIDDKKVGGILIKITGPHAIIGIGLNLNQPTFPPQIALHATSLHAKTGQTYSPLILTKSLTNQLVRVE